MSYVKIIDEAKFTALHLREMKSNPTFELPDYISCSVSGGYAPPYYTCEINPCDLSELYPGVYQYRGYVCDEGALRFYQLNKNNCDVPVLDHLLPEQLVSSIQFTDRFLLVEHIPVQLYAYSVHEKAISEPFEI
jgi:hypothetical protein